MKKQYKLSKHDDEEFDSISEPLKEMYISDEDDIWLDTGDKTIRLPKEVAEYIELNGILGIA